MESRYMSVVKTGVPAENSGPVSLLFVPLFGALPVLLKGNIECEP